MTGTLNLSNVGHQTHANTFTLILLHGLPSERRAHNTIYTKLVDKLRSKSAVGNNGCVVWTGWKDKNGYGSFRLPGADRRLVKTHRVAYELAVGPIPADLEIDHLCFNTSCINPAHMRVVDHKTNCQNLRTRLRPTCVAGHAWGDGDDKRICRVCRDARARAYHIAHPDKRREAWHRYDLKRTALRVA